MSISSEIQRIQTAKADLKTAIEGKGVTVPSGTLIDGYADLVEEIQTGGGGVTEPEPLDVDFIDYDGTLLYTYTASDFLALTEMPPNPSHDGLIAQGWNWTLEDAKEAVAECGFHVIGQNYTTSDGKTRIYITIDDGDSMLPQHILIYGLNGATWIIDWGDGETTTQSNKSNNATSSHTYTERGNFIITITVTVGTIVLGYNGSNQGLCWNNSVNGNDSARRVRKIEVGDGVARMGTQPFASLANLSAVSLPRTISNNNNPTWNLLGIYSLRGLVIPPNVTTIATANQAYKMRFISLPNGITSIGRDQYWHSVEKIMLPNTVNFDNTYMLRQCRAVQRLHIPRTTSITDYFCHEMSASLSEVTIPSTVTSIGRDAFNGGRLGKVYLKPTTPPALNNNNAFPNRSNNLRFYVPYSEDHSILEAYQTATNWSSYASLMEEEPQS